MRPTEILMNEHRLIEKVLGELEAMAAETERNTPPARERSGAVVEFLRGFADGCHHAKEERHLFPGLDAHGFSPDAGPVAVMLHEHEIGRSYIRAMDEAIGTGDDDPGSPEAFAAAARGYVALLSGHIAKEEQILFRMADSVLSEREQAEIAAGFDYVERNEMGIGTHERFHALADRILSRGAAPAA